MELGFFRFLLVWRSVYFAIQVQDLNINVWWTRWLEPADLVEGNDWWAGNEWRPVECCKIAFGLTAFDVDSADYILGDILKTGYYTLYSILFNGFSGTFTKCKGEVFTLSWSNELYNLFGSPLCAKVLLFMGKSCQIRQIKLRHLTRKWRSWDWNSLPWSH